MVIEMLTFDVPTDQLEAWLPVEEANWSRFLEAQDGFVRKEMWRSADDPTKVHAIIWWESMEQWKAIPQADLDAVIEAMGPAELPGTLTVFDLLRES
jgi:uncharacterized protein (TIGR03792 family)